MKKKIYSYDEIHRTVCLLAQKIIESPLKPELIIAVGGGGFIPARILRTYLEIPIYAISVVYYTGKGTGEKEPRLTQWLDKPEELLENRRILVIDEMEDTGATIGFCVDLLKKYNPAEIGLALLHKKIKEKKVDSSLLADHYFVGEELDDSWVSYPWDAVDIDNREE